MVIRVNRRQGWSFETEDLDIMFKPFFLTHAGKILELSKYRVLQQVSQQQVVRLQSTRYNAVLDFLWEHEILGCHTSGPGIHGASRQYGHCICANLVTVSDDLN
jgi:hypothetical protein